MSEARRAESNGVKERRERWRRDSWTRVCLCAVRWSPDAEGDPPKAERLMGLKPLVGDLLDANHLIVPAPFFRATSW